MNPISNLTLRASMALFSGIALTAIAALGVLGFTNMEQSEALAQQVLGDVQLTRAAGTADMMHDALRGDAQAAQLAGRQAPAQRKQALRDDVQKHVATLQTSLAEVEAGANNPALRDALLKVLPTVKTYTSGTQAYVDAALAGGVNDAQQQAFDDEFSALEKSLAELSGLIQTVSTDAVQEQSGNFVRARWTLAFALGLAALVTAAYSLLFVRTTMRRLGAEPQALREFSNRIAAGSLDGKFASAPAHDSVAGAMVRMQAMLAGAVRQIRAGADAVAGTSEQIAQGNDDLSIRTVQQASALEKTAASMAQLSSTVEQNDGNASQANALALSASSVAVRGGEVVGQVVDTMRGINDSSKRIADILSVIDGIAFQTNILALNAAVEAARAGEQGRGFAVVASEVRSLAGRSVNAAKEIKGLITASVERVERGSALVGQAGATMTELVASIKRVTDIVGEISSASAEQNAGVSHVGEAITQMDRATQQNAALVEQSAVAAESLKVQAEHLVQAVAVFTLGRA